MQILSGLQAGEGQATTSQSEGCCLCKKVTIRGQKKAVYRFLFKSIINHQLCPCQDIFADFTNFFRLDNRTSKGFVYWANVFDFSPWLKQGGLGTKPKAFANMELAKAYQ